MDTSDSTPMTATSAMAPLESVDRLRTLDVVRGFALCGIALMNVEFFTRPLSDAGSGIAAGQGPLDWLADAFVYVFVQGKFWTMFSMLFGMGFAVMAQRADSAGRDFVPIYLRRTGMLMLIGVLHAVFVWSGDVLFAYSLGALALLTLRSLPPLATWLGGGLLYLMVVGMLVLAAMATAMGMPDPTSGAAAAKTNALREAEIVAYSAAPYLQACAVRLRYFVAQFSGLVALLPMVLGMFLIGSGLVRSGAIRDPDAHPVLYRRLLWIGGPLGLLLTVASVLLSADPVHPGTAMNARDLLATALHLLGAPLMALAYLSVLIRAVHRGPGLFDALAPAGRMALTNYLLQSVIGTLVFYGYGLGLWGDVGRAGQLLGTCAVLAAQLLWSHGWMTRHHFGPMEWLWRAVTYLQWPPMRRRPGDAGSGVLHG